MEARQPNRYVLHTLRLVLVASLCFGVSSTVNAQSASPEPPADAVAHAREVYDRAIDFAGQGKMREALGPAEEALVLFEKAFGPDHRELIDPNGLVSNMRRDTGDLRGAEAPLLRALAICEREFGEENARTAIYLNNCGVLYRLLGYFGKARPYYERALAVRERVLGPEHPDTGQTHTNLGILLKEVGEYSSAQAEMLRGAGITEHVYGVDDPRTGVSAGVLASLATSQGNYAEADRLYQKALAIHDKALGPEHRTTLISLNNLSTHYLHTGAYEQARLLLVRLLETRTRLFGPEHPETLAAICNLGSVYVATGDTKRARPLFEGALEVSRKLYESDSEQMAKAFGYIANLEMMEGHLAAAEENFRRALAVREKQLGPDHPKTASGLAAVGSIHLARGEFEAARGYLQRAVAVSERTLGVEHPSSVSALRAWGDLLWATGQFADAVEVLRRANDSRERELLRNLTAGSEQRKMSYLELTAGELDRTISLHQVAARSHPAAASVALEIILRRKGRALDAMTGQIESLRQRSSPEDRALLRELAYARAEFARSALSVPNAATGGEAYRAELEKLQRRVDEFETLAAACSAEFRASALPVTLDGVREGVPPDAALVEFAVYAPWDPKARTSSPKRYTVYVLDYSGGITWSDLGPAADIDALVASFRRELRAPSHGRAVRAVGRALDERIMRPVRRLVAPGIKRLLVSPDGALNLVPFAALVDEHGRYLVEGREIVYLTSGRDLLRLRPGADGVRGGTAEIVANPDFGISAVATQTRLRFSPLPGTEAEARELGRLFPTAALLTGAEATESALKRMSAPSILHIATHGFYLVDDVESTATATTRRQWEATRDVVQIASPSTNAPGQILAAARGPLLRSGLGLAGANRASTAGQDDGLLTALEVAGLDLWGTQLVVLSACDTGVGEVRAGNGVYGLRRALTLAGAEAQVSSLWAVSDRSTRELMVAYYGELLAGRGRSEALRTTQLKMLKDPRRSHPFYWAGFIPSGAWWPLSGQSRER